jgi:hypothetical protein
MIFPATTNGGGKCFAFPDVCKTPAPPAPPVPIPYPNITQCSSIKGSTASSKVKILNKKTATVDTETSNSTGDNAGTVGGVVSNKNMAGAKYKKGSGKVFVEGKKIAHLTSMVGQNDPSNSNAPPGLQVAPSQTKVTVSP